MATANQPVVTVKLDMLEKERLKKIRNRMELTHWSNIEETYTLVATLWSDGWLDKLKKSKPAEYDEMFSDWEKRFSDFKLVWQKRQMGAELHGALIAVGRLRFQGLDNALEGAEATIMHGKLSGTPLPSCALTALRLNHVSVLIVYESEETRRIDNTRTTTSTTFRVGKNNKMFGKDAVEDNTRIYNEKMGRKKGNMMKQAIDQMAYSFEAMNTTMESRMISSTTRKGGNKICSTT